MEIQCIINHKIKGKSRLFVAKILAVAKFRRVENRSVVLTTLWGRCYIHKIICQIALLNHVIICFAFMGVKCILYPICDFCSLTVIYREQNKPLLCYRIKTFSILDPHHRSNVLWCPRLFVRPACLSVYLHDYTKLVQVSCWYFFVRVESD